MLLPADYLQELYEQYIGQELGVGDDNTGEDEDILLTDTELKAEEHLLGAMRQQKLPLRVLGLWPYRWWHATLSHESASLEGALAAVRGAVRGSSAMILDIDIDFFHMKHTDWMGDLLKPTNFAQYTSRRCAQSLQSLRALSIPAVARRWCQQLVSQLQARERAGQAYLRRFVLMEGERAGVGEAIEQRLAVFQQLLEQLAREGVQPIAVTLVDSVGLLPPRSLLPLVAAEDQQEVWRMGGDYTRPWLALYLHRRVVQVLRQVWPHAGLPAATPHPQVPVD